MEWMFNFLYGEDEVIMVQKVRLGRSDLVVTPIGLGTNAVGGHNLYPNLDEQVGKELVMAALRMVFNARFD